MSVKITGYDSADTNRKPVSIKTASTNPGSAVDSEGKPILVTVSDGGFIHPSLIQGEATDVTADIIAMSIALG